MFNKYIDYFTSGRTIISKLFMKNSNVVIFPFPFYIFIRFDNF